MASKKEQLRQLMRERKEAKKGTRIESPLAKYDSLGKLSCVICNISVKEVNWSSHLLDRGHKEKLEAIKRSKLSRQLSSSVPLSTASPSYPVRNVEKRPSSSSTDHQDDGPLRKSMKLVDSSSSNQSGQQGSIAVEDDDDYETEEERRIAQRAIKVDFSRLIRKEDLPKKVEKVPTNSTADQSMGSVNEDNKADEELIKPNELPKGFFDDPKADAKTRNIPYKNPLDEEMEVFKKMIAEETIKSQSLVEEQLEEIQIDRDFEEIEEQMKEWAKVNDLQKQADELKAKSASDSWTNDDEDVDEDDLDLSEIDVFSNWRAKSTLRNPLK